MTQYFKLAAILAAVPFIALLFVNRWSVDAQTKVETAGEKFKNIRVLYDMPADQLGRVMNIMAASLGVKCGFCHVGDDFSKDDKGEKQTARKMLQMTFDINKNNFNGRSEVSCNTCHNGMEHPQSAPNLNAPSTLERPLQPETKPTVDQIIGKYLTALGGTAKLSAIKTRYIKANRVEPGGEVIEPETILFDGNKYTLSTVYSEVTVSEGFDGTVVWKTSGTERIILRPDESEQIKREAEFFNPANIKSIYSQMNYRSVDLVDTRPAYLVTATTKSGARERLYFDLATGLLVRRAVSSPTILGPFTYQVDYQDYKLFAGVKLPTTIEYSMPGIRWTRKVIQVRNNVPVDAAKFNAPAK
jgi:hypothetical protein